MKTPAGLAAGGFWDTKGESDEKKEESMESQGEGICLRFAYCDIADAGDGDGSAGK